MVENLNCVPFAQKQRFLKNFTGLLGTDVLFGTPDRSLPEKLNASKFYNSDVVYPPHST